MTKSPLTLLLACIALLCGCDRSPHTAASATLGVCVSIPPELYFVKRIGGKRVSVDVLVTPGQNPHSYTPTPSQMARLSQAKLFLRIGIEFEESLVPKIKGIMKGITVVDLRDGVRMRRMEDQQAELADSTGGQTPARASADDDEHRGGPDPHIWTDPMIVKHMAATIRDALVRLDPAGRAVYEANAATFAAELDSVDRRIRTALAPLAGGAFFTFHPELGYFADAYGLKQVGVEIGGKEPSGRELARLTDLARHDHVRVIFVQPQFSARSAQAIAEQIGGVVEPLDALSEDYLANLEHVAAEVAKALAQEKR
jgi:zinc transport system substrate-binding protein